MTSYRDQALAHMAAVRDFYAMVPPPDGDLLDAIPPDVLTGLAIESGGLIEAGVYDPADYTVRSTVYYEDEDRPDDAVALYRVMHA